MTLRDKCQRNDNVFPSANPAPVCNTSISMAPTKTPNKKSVPVTLTMFYNGRGFI